MDIIGIFPKEAHSYDMAALKQVNDSVLYADRSDVSRLPWKSSHPTLPITYPLAQGMLSSTLKRPRDNSVLLERYNDVVHEQLQRRFMEKVSMTEQSKASPR